MTQNKWHELARIADLKFRNQAQSMAALQRQFGDLAQRRQALTAMADAARDGYRGVHPSHFHSGDVQWQAWVGRNESDLNMEAARLEAQREILLPELRRAFGQKLASEEIAKKSRQKPSRYR